LVLKFQLKTRHIIKSKIPERIIVVIYVGGKPFVFKGFYAHSIILCRKSEYLIKYFLSTILKKDGNYN
jgi:hypothetical protein